MAERSIFLLAVLIASVACVQGQNASLTSQPKTVGTQEDKPWGPMQLRVAERVSQAMIVTKVEPECPAEARKKQVKGDVVVALVVDQEGNVAKAMRVQGNPILGPAAVAAVKQYKYRPYLLAGKPVEIETAATVHFK